LNQLSLRKTVKSDKKVVVAAQTGLLLRDLEPLKIEYFLKPCENLFHKFVELGGAQEKIIGA
jgi:hypothetical protein